MVETNGDRKTSLKKKKVLREIFCLIFFSAVAALCVLETA
jgi:hypothetical protein